MSKDISVRKLSQAEIEQMQVFSWPIWEKEVSTFDWVYDQEENCYIIKGRVTVTPENGESVTFGIGDFVVFPSGMKCVWDVHEEVRKHYKFS